jgi:hypothetical protein
MQLFLHSTFYILHSAFPILHSSFAPSVTSILLTIPCTLAPAGRQKAGNARTGKPPFLASLVGASCRSPLGRLVLRPSSFVLRPSSFGLRPSSFALRPSSFVLRPSSFVLWPLAFVLRPSPFVLWPSSFVLWPSSFALRPLAFGLRPLAFVFWPSSPQQLLTNKGFTADYPLFRHFSLDKSRRVGIIANG